MSSIDWKPLSTMPVGTPVLGWYTYSEGDRLKTGKAAVIIKKPDGSIRYHPEDHFMPPYVTHWAEITIPEKRKK